MKVGDKVKVVDDTSAGTLVESLVKSGKTCTIREIRHINGQGLAYLDDLQDGVFLRRLAKVIKAHTKALSMHLSEDPTERKGTPITTGVLDYFPRALAAVAKCSKAGNDQHNPGQPLHWDKSKSTDHADCIARHLIDRNTNDTDGIPHAAKLAWRALALLETMLEQEKK